MTVGELQSLSGGDVLALTFPVWMIGLAIAGVALRWIGLRIASLFR
jgi:hypothetical protein